jgi:DnaJ-class molecular chaperone
VNDDFNSEKKKVKKTVKDKGIHPERYGMVFCSHCSGSGKYFYANRGVSVCQVCGGFGLVRMEIFLIAPATTP